MKDAMARVERPRVQKGAANVFILTYCRNMELFYGTDLIFKTLRVGFPNANVVVVDNASIPEARTAVEVLAKENDCVFEQIPTPGIQHHEFIQNTLSAVADDSACEGPLVFLDPDVCLWESCEDFDFEGRIAGKLIIGFNDSITQAVMMPRLHSSFLWIPDARELQNTIRKIRTTHFDFEPFASFSFVLEGTWHRYDTGASLYAAIPDRVSYFDEQHLNRFDHLAAGSHIDLLYPHYNSTIREMMADIHKNAREGNLQALKGMWRHQKEVWMEFLNQGSQQCKEDL